MTWDGVSASVLALTPIEKWKAARGLGSDSGLSNTSDYWFFVLAVAALVVLAGLLWQVSNRRRKTQSKGLSGELFAENAIRRGLSGRERQILLAIAMRSGLGPSHDVFTTVEAFDRGAAKLLAECLRTRTVDENERLKTEMQSLREKLGFQGSQDTAGLAQARRPSSHDVPVGSVLELIRHHGHPGETIQAQVIRNDDIELAVELHAAVETQAGDVWRVRYNFGMSVWEFDTTAVGGARTRRLVLNHCDHVRFVNRRRFPRVAVNIPALVAHFPFMRSEAPPVQEVPMGADRAGDLAASVLDAPVFVPGVVTELAGPGLRIEVPLQIRAGDRVVVAFKLARMAAGNGEDEESNSGCIVENVGQVRHGRSTNGRASIAVELTGLSEVDIGALVRITNIMSSRNSESDDEGPHSAQESLRVAAGNST